MPPKVLLVIMISVGLSAFAQIALKAGMGSQTIQNGILTGASRVQIVIAVAQNPYILLGLMLYGLGVVSWLVALARVDVSMAYPFMGLGFIVTMLLAVAFLGESISGLRILGTVLVTTGVVLISKS